MNLGVHFEGSFLDVYPYMDWVFLLAQDGDLLFCRTDELIPDNKVLHDAMFRQAAMNSPSSADELNVGTIKLSTKKFRKLAKLPDGSKFCDLRFFYSNIFCGSEDGLQFLSFDTSTEKVVREEKVTDAPIASLTAKFMTVFAASLEDRVTTLFNVSAGGYAKKALTGSTATRIGVSDASVNYYFGPRDLSLAAYSRSKVESDNQNVQERDAEKIDLIGDAQEYSGDMHDVDFVFNSNGGLYFVRGTKLEYRMNNGSTHFFNIGLNGKLIRAHLFRGLQCFEFIEGLYVVERNGLKPLLEGECISSRGYANSTNFKNSVSAVNESGAYIFRID